LHALVATYTPADWKRETDDWKSAAKRMHEELHKQIHGGCEFCVKLLHVTYTTPAATVVGERRIAEEWKRLTLHIHDKLHRMRPDRCFFCSLLAEQHPTIP
jgi:hypothetical protein